VLPLRIPDIIGSSIQLTIVWRRRLLGSLPHTDYSLSRRASPIAIPTRSGSTGFINSGVGEAPDMETPHGARTGFPRRCYMRNHVKLQSRFRNGKSADVPFRAPALQINKMKDTYKMKSRHLTLSAIVALAVLLPQSRADEILGSADSFTALGGSTVTSTGNTILNGDLGLSPGTAITGFTFSTTPGLGIVNGTTSVGGIAVTAQADVLSAYNYLAGETPNQNLTGQDLGGFTLSSGVYHFDTSAQLTGILTLDAGNNPDARFDFLIGSTLTTASIASVLLINDAQADNVFWQVGSSATLGTDTSFNGSILADQSITLNTGTSMTGRALAMNGAVTLDDNILTVPVAAPEPGSFWLLAMGATVFGGWSRLAMWRRKTGRS
jgi:type VI secretion system secreted protein VgrG